MKRLIYTLLAWFITYIGSQAQDYAVSNIPDSLLTGSHSVIRCLEYRVNMKSLSSVEYSCRQVVTIMNASGRYWCDFSSSVSKFETLKSFRATIYDKTGKAVKQYKKSDLNYSEFSQHFSTDIAHYFKDFDTPEYPVTVEITFEKSRKDFIATLPIFTPFSGSEGVALQHASYSLSVPKGLSLNITEENWNTPFTKTSDKDADCYLWNVENIPSIKRDYYMPDIEQSLIICPSRFEYEGNEVQMDTWSNFGVWMSSLLEGRDVLPDELKTQIHAITDNLSSDKEKAQRLYDYMCENCRYVSVQVGIGGIQPISAAEVYKTKFGDCKGLSYFLGAMLKEVGINSNLVFISTHNARIDKEKVTLATTNHAILKVVLPDETLWVECTDSSLPFGFIHNSIDGHDAIVIDGDRTRVETLPRHPDSDNSDTQIVNIDVNSNGGSHFDIRRTYCVGEYDFISGIATLNRDAQKAYFAKRIPVSGLVVNELTIDERKTDTPTIQVDISADTYKYGTSSGARTFLTANPFRPQMSKIDPERLYDINVKYGYNQCDTIKLTIPDNLTVEALPKPTSFESEIGCFSSQIHAEGNYIVITQLFKLNSGIYPRSKASDMNRLITTTNSSRNAKIVLKKK